MSNNKKRGQAVIILVQYENEHGLQEARYPGFLTGNDHAMYVETKYKRLMFVSVEPSGDHGEYLETSGFCSLGEIDASYDSDSLIKDLAHVLHNMSAYEFIAKVIAHVRTEIEFEDLIIPHILDGE